MAKRFLRAEARMRCQRFLHRMWFRPINFIIEQILNIQAKKFCGPKPACSAILHEWLVDDGVIQMSFQSSTYTIFPDLYRHEYV